MDRDGFALWEATSVVLVVNKPKTAKGVLLLAVPTHPRAPQASPRADGINCDGVDYKSLAAVLAVAIAASPSSTTTCVVEREGSRRLGDNLDR